MFSWTRLASPSTAMCAQKVVSVTMGLYWETAAGLGSTNWALLWVVPNLILVAAANLCKFFKDTSHFPLEAAFYTKTLHVDNQLQRVFNGKRNVCNAEASCFARGCFAAQKWEIPGACMFNLTPKIQLGGPV